MITAQCWTLVHFSFSFRDTLQGKSCHHLQMRETEARALSVLPETLELVSGRAGMRTELPKSVFLPL